MQPISPPSSDLIRAPQATEACGSQRGTIDFTVIIPLEFHRGQAVDCLRGWTDEQAYPRARYEIILASPPDFPAGELASLRRLLAPHDQVLQLSGRHDMALCAEAAMHASGEVLFFTESHCTPEPDTLEKSFMTLQTHDHWDGFSCQSVPVTHNLLSQIEAKLYEKDITYAMRQHPWRKVLDQCFVIRRAAYFKVGGFDADLGHFAEWLLAARLHKAGCKIGYAPDIRVRHFYLGQWSEWHEFTQDFSVGEMRFLAREMRDSCQGMFEEVPEWTARSQMERRTARRMLRLMVRDVSRMWTGVRGAKQRLRALRRWDWSGLRTWAARAIFGGWSVTLPAMAWERWTRLQLAWYLFCGNEQGALRAIHGCCQAITTTERVKFLMRHVREEEAHADRGHNDASEFGPAGTEEVSWQSLSSRRLVGFHLYEGSSRARFRWSEPTACVELPIEPGKHLITLAWHPACPPAAEAKLRFYLNERPIPPACVSRRSDHAEIRLDTSNIRPIRLGWTTQAIRSKHDRRRLGLAISEIRWCRQGAAMDLEPQSPIQPPQRPLLFIHVRKTAGAALRNLLENRFSDQDHFFQAHSVRRPATDPGLHRFVTGHVDFSYVARFAQRPLVFTVLRNPVERVHSTFYFFREHDEARFRELETDLSGEDCAQRREFTQLANRLSLYEFLTQEPELARRHLSNIQTRSLLDGRPSGDLRLADLSQALKNLSQCDVIGLTERLPETLTLLASAMGWEGLGPIHRWNQTQHRPATNQEDPRALEILREWNQFDSRIYAEASSIFEKRLQQLTDASPQSRPEYASFLPDAQQFTFDQAIHGWGWHVRERVSAGWICWTGDDAWLDLRNTHATASTLRCRIHSVISKHALATLQITVNDQVLSHVCWSESQGLRVECQVPGEVLERRHGFVRIGFRVSQAVLPSGLKSGLHDDRRLGIALQEIDLS